MHDARLGSQSRRDVEHALQIVKDSFGPAARQVFETISRRGRLTFEQIVAASHLRKKTCGIIMHTLLKHGCLSCKRKILSHVSRSRSLTIYSVALAHTKSRQRFSNMLRCIQDRYAGEHRFVFFSLMMHGSLSYKQLLKIAVQSNKQTGSRLEEFRLQKAFNDLVLEDCIHRDIRNHDFQNAAAVSLNPIFQTYASQVIVDKPSVVVVTNSIKIDFSLEEDSNCFWRINFAKVEGILLSPDIQVLCASSSTSREYREKFVEAVIRSRLGCQALRIYRVLLNLQLEQKQIAELSMVPIKDTRDLLYKLLKCGYVQMQEIARTHDHAPSRTNYLWRASYPAVENTIKDEILQTASNVSMRLIAELRRKGIRKSDLDDQMCCEARNTSDSNMKDTDGKRLERLEVTIARLYYALFLFEAH